MTYDPIDPDADGAYDTNELTVNTLNGLDLGANIDAPLRVDGQTVFTASSGAFDLNNYTHEKNLSSNVEDAQGLDISNDGTRLYVMNRGNVDEIRQYNLSTPFDIGSASFITNFSNSSSDPKGVTISDDGFTMLDTGGFFGPINEIQLSTAFELSSASRTNNDITGNNLSSVHFANSGNLLLITDIEDDHVRTFELNTPFDITTRTNEKTAPFTQKIGSGAAFSASGLKIFVAASDSGVLEFQLSSPFDISGFDENNVIATLPTTQGGYLRDVVFKPDGSKLYIANQDGFVEQHTL